MKSTRYYMLDIRVCGNCAHYHQHYVLRKDGSFAPVWYGHCCVPNWKHPQPDEACPHWTSAYDEEPVSAR